MDIQVLLMERNPAPVDMYSSRYPSIFLGFSTSEVIVWDFLDPPEL